MNLAAVPRKITIVDVARHAGVSTMTVSRVVNGSDLVSAATRHRVERAMRELAYIPNRAARSLVVNKLGVLALMIPDISNPFFPLLVRGAEAAAREAGYTIVLGNSDEQFDKEDAYLRAVCALRVDGVVLAPSGMRSRHSLEMLLRQRIPFVLVDRSVDGVASDVVRGESRRACAALTEHLHAGHGHVRIGMISGPADVSTARDRELGYLDALEASGLPVDPSLVRHTAYTRQGGHVEALALLGKAKRPTAVVTANNFLAFGVIDAARELGLRVPEDLAVVGYNDIEVAAYLGLTTVHVPMRELGRRGVELLLRAVEQPETAPERVRLPAELVVRRDRGQSVAESGASLVWLALLLVITPVVIWWWTQGVWGDFSALRPLQHLLDTGPQAVLRLGSAAGRAAPVANTLAPTPTPGGAPSCPAGSQPRFVLGFARLKQQLGATMGDPLECEHADPMTGDTVQRTTTGLAIYRPREGLPIFTDGWHHWALTDHGVVRWESTDIDAPPALLAELRPGGPSPSS
jgi:LacI family transcriptional regulator